MKFSKYYKISQAQNELDFLDIDLDVDTLYFIDPFRIGKNTKNINLANKCVTSLQDYFLRLMDLILDKNEMGAISILSKLHEPGENRIGYGVVSSKGAAIGDVQARQIYEMFAKSGAVVSNALRDIEDTTLYIEGIKHDKISDMVANIIRHHLIKYTQEQCRIYGIQDLRYFCNLPQWNGVKNDWYYEKVRLPYDSKGEPIILTPKSFLGRHLAITAKDFAEHGVLPYMQNEHLNNPASNLVRTIKGERKAPTKKILISTGIDLSKAALLEFNKAHPDVLATYKKERDPNVNRATGKKVKGTFHKE